MDICNLGILDTACPEVTSHKYFLRTRGQGSIKGREFDLIAEKWGVTDPAGLMPVFSKSRRQTLRILERTVQRGIEPQIWLGMRTRGGTFWILLAIM
jgi:hypothetical protein